MSGRRVGIDAVVRQLAAQLKKEGRVVASARIRRELLAELPAAPAGAGAGARTMTPAQLKAAVAVVFARLLVAADPDAR